MTLGDSSNERSPDCMEKTTKQNGSGPMPAYQNGPIPTPRSPTLCTPGYGRPTEFTQEHDRAIWTGYHEHGKHWKKIRDGNDALLGTFSGLEIKDKWKVLDKNGWSSDN